MAPLINTPRLAELWQDAAMQAGNGSSLGNDHSAVGLLLPSDTFDRQPQLFGPLQQALANGGVVLRLGWRSAIGRAAHRLRADARRPPVPWGGAPLSPSADQLMAMLLREESADEALRRLATRLLNRPVRQLLQRVTATNSSQLQHHGSTGSDGGSDSGGGGGSEPSILRVNVEQLSAALNETVSGALRAMGLPAAHGRWWSIEAEWMLDNWQRAAARAGSDDDGHGSGGEAAVASVAAEMSMQDYYTMLRALEAEDAATEGGATGQPSPLAPLLSRLDALPVNSRGRTQRKAALLQHVRSSWRVRRVAKQRATATAAIDAATAAAAAAATATATTTDTDTDTAWA